MDRKIPGNDDNRAARGFDRSGLLGLPGRGLPGEGKPPGLPETSALTGAPDVSPTVSFSKDDVPEKQPVAIWREHFGRTALRVEIEPTEEEPFEANVNSRILPGLHLLESGLSAARLSRTRRPPAAGKLHEGADR